MATQPMKTLTIDNVTYEIVDDASRQRTGELSGLNTDTKTNIVAAINEHETQINNTYTKSQVDTKIDESIVTTDKIANGAVTLSKFNQEVLNNIKSDGHKKIWAIQTNANEDGSFYGLSASSDGFGQTLVDDYYNFLDVTGRNLGTDWQHFQQGDYHVFTITHKTSTVDFYLAITQDFETWVHNPIQIGLASASGYSDPYVWTPQIFEFNNKLYISATVQEDAPVADGDFSGNHLLRKSGIYVAEIQLNYNTASITRTSEFTRITFGKIHDLSNNEYEISGNAMDAWFVPNSNQLYCVFNERYMQEIHTAVASNITDTFDIVAENIFKMPFVEAPTVLQINNNLWKISACVWEASFTAEEENVCCYTSDFENFYNYGYMQRLDVSTSNGLYTGRMRNPSFFYMTNAQEHNFCMSHEVRTQGYVHRFKPTTKTISTGYNNVLNATDVDIQPEVSFKASASNLITLASDYSDANITDVMAIKSNDCIDLRATLGNVKAVTGANTIGNINALFRPTGSRVHFVAYAGTGTTLGTAMRGEITSAGDLILYSASSWSGYSTIRFECCYLNL